MTHWRTRAAAIVTSMIVAGGGGFAQAQDAPDLISFGAGWFDVLDDEDSLDLRLEYRFGRTFFRYIKPWVGIEANTDGAVYGVGGLLADIPLGSRFVLTPMLGAGLYSEGDSKDLGHAVEFRTQIELGYRFDDESRVSLGFSHTSNASLDDENPGVEAVMIYYHLPVQRLFGN